MHALHQQVGGEDAQPIPQLDEGGVKAWSDIFTRDPKQAAQLGQARAGAESALARAEEEWLEASALSDEAAG